MSLLMQNLAVYCLQVTILVAIGGLLPFAGRLQNVRARLAWWQALLGVCLLLPLIEPWKQTIIRTSIEFSTRAAGAIPAPDAPAPAPFPWEMVLALIAVGIVLRLAWLALGVYRLRVYLDRATLYSCPLARRMEVHAYVGLSPDVNSPVTFGVRRPVILFPSRFANMDPVMQETIACHELLHVERRDWLFTVAEELVRAVLWFHPAIWWLLGEIQLTREQVVDNQVVRLTQSREHYLNALLAIASTRARLDLAPAPLFLRKRHLSQRIAQILKEVTMSRTRIAASFAGISSILLLAGWFMVRALPLEAAPQIGSARSDSPGVSVEQAEANLLHRAPVDYPPEARAKGIHGTVLLEVEIDETGAVSDARVLSGPQELRRAALQSVLQWHYARTMPLPAKTQVSIKFDLTAPPLPPTPPATRRTPAPAVRLPEPSTTQPPILRVIDLGSLPEALQKDLREKLSKHEGSPLTSEVMQQIARTIDDADKHLHLSVIRTAEGTATLKLSLDTPAPPASIYSREAPAVSAAATSSPQRIRVGGNVQQSMLIEQFRPVYPPMAKQARIQGVVRFNAIIARDGTVANLEVLTGHPLLVPAALEAVRQWVYKPTLLNGEPVEVITQIDVNFTLAP